MFFFNFITIITICLNFVYRLKLKHFEKFEDITEAVAGNYDHRFCFHANTKTVYFLCNVVGSEEEFKKQSCG